MRSLGVERESPIPDADAWPDAFSLDLRSLRPADSSKTVRSKFMVNALANSIAPSGNDLRRSYRSCTRAD